MTGGVVKRSDINGGGFMYGPELMEALGVSVVIGQGGVEFCFVG